MYFTERNTEPRKISNQSFDPTSTSVHKNLRIVLFYLISLLSIVLFLSCSNSSESENSIKKNSIVVFPQNLSLAGEGNFIKEPADYTIVSYYDSTDCMGCSMKLSYWQDFMEEMTKSFPKSKLNILIISGLTNEKELIVIKRRAAFKYKIAIDNNQVFRESNNLPADKRSHTFLIDSNNKVITIGNPLYDRNIFQEYIDSITKDYSKPIEGTTFDRNNPQ